MARMNQTRLAAKLQSFRREGDDMTLFQRLNEKGSSTTLGKFLMDNDLQVRAFLNTVRTQLLHGNISDEIKLQEEIDEAEYNDRLKKTKNYDLEIGVRL